jgi:hypothetical protein
MEDKNVKEHIVDIIKNQKWAIDSTIFEVIRLEYSLTDPHIEMELLDLWAADIIECLPIRIDPQTNLVTKIWRINPKFQE